MVITRCAVVDHIEGLLDTAGAGSFKLCFQDGTFATVESGKIIKELAAFFGCEDGKGYLQEKIHGLQIVYCMTFDRRLRGFTPAKDWEGPEMNEGDFLVDCCPCNGWDYRQPTIQLRRSAKVEP